MFIHWLGKRCWIFPCQGWKGSQSCKRQAQSPYPKSPSKIFDQWHFAALKFSQRDIAVATKELAATEPMQLAGSGLENQELGLADEISVFFPVKAEPGDPRKLSMCLLPQNSRLCHLSTVSSPTQNLETCQCVCWSAQNHPHSTIIQNPQAIESLGSGPFSGLDLMDSHVPPGPLRNLHNSFTFVFVKHAILGSTLSVKEGYLPSAISPRYSIRTL